MRPVTTAQLHADSEKQPAAVAKTQAPVAPPEKEKNEMSVGEKLMQDLDKEYEAFRDSLKEIRGKFCMVKVISDKNRVNIAENPAHHDYIPAMMNQANYELNKFYFALGDVGKEQFLSLLGVIAKLDKALLMSPRNYDFCGALFSNIFIFVLRMVPEAAKSTATRWLLDQLFLKLQHSYKAFVEANLSATRYISTADAVQKSDKKIAVDLGRQLETTQTQYEELSRTFEQFRNSTSQMGSNKISLFRVGNGRHFPASSKAEKGAAPPTDATKITWVANPFRLEIVELLLDRRSDFMGQHKQIAQEADTLGLGPIKVSIPSVNAKVIDHLIKEILSHVLTGKKLKDIFQGLLKEVFQGKKPADIEMMGLAKTLMDYTKQEDFEKKADEVLPEFVMKKRAKSLSEVAIKFDIATTLFQLYYKPQKPGETVNKEKVLEPDAAFAKEFGIMCANLEAELKKESKKGNDLQGQVMRGPQ